MSQPPPTPKDILCAHATLFVATYHQHPPRYTARDARHAKDLITHYGADGAHRLLKDYFACGDAWIRRSGHTLALLASSTVQSKLLAWRAGRHPRVDPQVTRQQAQTEEWLRLMREEGYSRAEAGRKVGW
jgi:hypothetical protein